MEITLFQVITLGVAVLGATLGIINAWHGLDKSRVKLKVTPAHAIQVGATDPRIKFCIEEKTAGEKTAQENCSRKTAGSGRELRIIRVYFDL